MIKHGNGYKVKVGFLFDIVTTILAQTDFYHDPENTFVRTKHMSLPNPFLSEPNTNVKPRNISIRARLLSNKTDFFSLGGGGGGHKNNFPSARHIVVWTRHIYRDARENNLQA